MNKTLQRFLLFFIGIPLIIGAIYIFPFYNHLVLQIMIIFATFCSSLEMSNILKTRLKIQNSILTAILSTTLPIIALICSIFNFNPILITFFLVINFLLLLIIEIFKPNNDMYRDSLSRIASALMIVMYPGFLITFISRMTIETYSAQILSTFLLMVFACDSLAWVFGVSMGKGNRGFIKASPNKSIVGFIGGIVGSVLVGILVYYIFPQQFGSSMLKVCLLGLLTSCASILGDLAESVFKRSGEIKDSGKIIPGRGGLLDSIDSILMTAPVFYMYIIIVYGANPL